MSPWSVFYPQGVLVWKQKFLPQNFPTADWQEAGLIPAAKKDILRWTACILAIWMKTISLKFENSTQTTSIFSLLGSDGLDLSEICSQEYSFIPDITFYLYTHSVKLTSAAPSVFCGDYNASRLFHLQLSQTSIYYSYHNNTIFIAGGWP